MYRTLLVPTDFSACSDAALAEAGRIAAAVGGRVHVIHAVELAGGLTPETLVQPANRKERTSVDAYVKQETLPRVVAQAARALGPVAHGCRVAFGKPADAVLEVAREVGADLIVVGTHGRTGLRALVLGSVAESIVRRADVPVLTVRRPEGEPQKPAADGSTG
jgi:nucleotide-binding universal stress UspA family protein